MNEKAIYMPDAIERENTENSQIIEIANILLDTDLRQVHIHGKAMRLTLMEFDLLSHLAANRNRVISRKELLRDVWHFENLVETRATDDMIKRLRKKLRCAGSQLKIITVWGYGFKVEVSDNTNN
jgi:two-component system, OmpR family, response regulator